MGFGKELSGFAEAFRGGYEIGSKARERHEKTRKPTDKDLAPHPGIGEGIGKVGTTPGVDTGGTGSTGADYDYSDIKIESDPQAARVLGMIRQVEAGDNPYNKLVGGKTGDLTNMTVGEVLNYQKDMIKKGHESTALGAYQFINETLNSAVDHTRIPLDAKFDQATQDKLGYYLLQKRGWHDYKAGKLDADTFMDNLASEWASLPLANGKSKYAGVGSNKALIGRDAVASAIDLNAPVKAADATATESGAGVLPEPDATTTGSVTQTSSQPQAKTFIDAATAKQMDPDIVRITERAARENPGLFAFNPKTKTLRTPEEQADMVKKGWSKTQKSKHLEGKAVDLVPINPDTGQPDPDYAVGYDAISKAMAKAAKDEGVDDYEWGGNWKSFQDKPHHQVSMLEQEQQIQPGGLTTPEEEQQVRPAMFAASGGAIPEPVQAFQWGGQPAPMPITGGGATYARAPVQASTPSSFVPRRVGQPRAAAPAAATPAASSQGSYVERFRKMQADQAAARAAAAAKPAAVQPSYTDDRRIQANIAYNQAQQNKPSQYRVNEQQPGGWFKMQKAKQQGAAWDKMYGGEEGRTRFIDQRLAAMNKNAGGFEEGGAVPEPEEFFANGGKVESRDEKFKRYQREASVGGRAGEGGQDARDRAAKRLSAEEGRPISTAYSPVKDSKYFQPAKPRKGKSDGQVKPGLDVKPTSGVQKAKAAGTPTAGYEPKPKAKAAGTPTAGYEPEKAKAAGTPTAGYEPKAKAAGTPTAPYELKSYERPDEAIPPPVDTGPDLARSAADAEFKRRPYGAEMPVGPGGEPPSIAPKPLSQPVQDPVSRYWFNPDTGAIVGTPDYQPEIPSAPVPERFAPDISAADAQDAARQEWIQKSMGYQHGGIIPEEDEEERFQPPLSPRAIDAGRTPPPARPAAPAGETPMTPQTAPAEPEPAEAAPSTAASAGAPAEEERPRANVRATPALLSDVSKALDGGIKFLQRTFGLSQDGAVPTPEGDAASQQGMQRFASGEGAATQDEINSIDDKIDPNRELDEGHRQMNRIAQTMQWYRSQGREDEAQAAAASLMQYGAQRMSKLGAMASAAYKQYQQTGNREDLDNTVRFMEKAYQMIPDGANFDVSLDESSGQLVATHIDSEGEEETYNISPDELPGYLKKAQDGSGYWGSVFRIADPEGAKVMERKKETEDERAYERSETREERGYEEGKEKEKRTYEEQKEAREAEAEAKKNAQKAKDEALENDRRAKRDADIRRREKLEAAAIAESAPGKKEEFVWEEVAPFVQAADAAQDALKANKGDPDLTKARDRAYSRLQDALGGDAKKMEEYGYDADFTYTRAEEEGAPRKAKDGKWYVRKPNGKYAEVEAPTS